MEILEALVSGLRTGVEGGESRLKLLAIILVAAAEIGEITTVKNSHRGGLDSAETLRSATQATCTHQY